MKDENKAIRKRSGDFASKDKLTAFFYFLMRDYVTPGKLEEIMEKHLDGRKGPYSFSNGWLGKHAEDLAKRLKKK